MAYDITFHPLSAADLRHFVIDVLEDPGLIGSRAAEAAHDPDKQEILAGVYERMLEIEEGVRAGRDPFGALALGIAAVAGFRQPFWYARGAALSFIAAEEDEPRIAPLLASLTTLAPERWRGLPDPAPGRISDNFTGGGIVSAHKLPALKRLILADNVDEIFGEVFSDEALEALESAIDHALAHGCGLMEAADLVDPSEEEAFTDLDNLRAPWLEPSFDHQGESGDAEG